MSLVSRPLLDTELFVYRLGRAALTSEDGHCGLGPHSVQLGDCLAFLEGGKVPYVLRPLRRRGEAYEVIRDRHINGIMQGDGSDRTKSAQIGLV